ncbi:MAG: aminotransferase, class [Polaromonas sp.]|jgi:CAI-1 autoinducer synthase|nr:aminotransferase, class [Polaromonas sp.]
MQVLDRTISPSPATPRNPPLLPRLRERFEQKFMAHWQSQWGGKPILHGSKPGSDSIRLDGNDYLGIAGHPDIVRAQIASLQHSNESVIQSGVFLLDAHPCRTLEASLAQWVGKEDGFICQSGYSANVGLLQAIADEQTPVYLDSLAHTSLWEGARAARAPAHAFRHNDPEHLSRMIERHGPGVVVVDSVYSTTGALCPLVRMVEVVEQHGCTILVDESHSLGTHGPQGAGLCAELGLTDRVHFISASLAKAFAGRAGFFTIPAAMRYYVLHNSYPNIFSSCLLPHEIAGLAATLEVVRHCDAERLRLHANTRRLRASLSDLGYPVHQGSQQIIALEAATEPATMVLRDQLEAHQVFGAIFCAPATSRNRAMVRLTLNAGLTGAEMDRIELTARKLAPVLKPWDWPIARRPQTVQV